MHNSKTSFYRLTVGVDRVIGTKVDQKSQPMLDNHGQPDIDPTQDLHRSVRERWDGDKSYRPKNLCDYFERIGDPRHDQ